MLVAAGDKEKFNMMTASWGSMGYLWNKPVVMVFVRPQRYTFEFTERKDEFTLSFFDEKYRHALDVCGSVSGRDVNKVQENGESSLTLVAIEKEGLIDTHTSKEDAAVSSDTSTAKLFVL